LRDRTLIVALSSARTALAFQRVVVMRKSTASSTHAVHALDSERSRHDAEGLS
jgi:hypothetical protein